MQHKAKTLIIGATGKTRRRVADRLRQQEMPILPVSRSTQPGFEWNDQNTWLPAVDGVKAMYVTYYPDLAFRGAAETVRTFVNMAVANGVRRVVLLSGRGEEGAQAAERAVRESGADWTLIRASWFNQNFSESYLLEPVLSGEVAFPAGDVQEPFIDADDIADIAAAALSGPKHSGNLYEVSGPRLLTFGDAVNEIAKATGRDIRYIPVSIGEYSSAMLQQGVPPEFVRELMDLFANILDGRNASLTDGVQRALGREPRDFSDFVHDAAARGAWGSAAAAVRR
jgi:uncharacterized protein YbjT (DUF2867 family)